MRSSVHGLLEGLMRESLIISDRFWLNPCLFECFRRIFPLSPGMGAQVMGKGWAWEIMEVWASRRSLSWVVGCCGRFDALDPSTLLTPRRIFDRVSG